MGEKENDLNDEDGKKRPDFQADLPYESSLHGHRNTLWTRRGVRHRIPIRAMPNVLSVAEPDSKYKQPGARPAGFLGGFRHGPIAPIAFLVSLFHPGIQIYETHNNGRWYEPGFLLGISAHAGDKSAGHALGG